VLVHSPAGWDGATPLPAVLLLPGFAGSAEDQLGSSLLDPSLPGRLDRLFLGGCAPFHTVVPDVMTALGGSQYLDSPGMGAWLSYLVDVVRPAVDEAVGTTGRWGATGRSSGALGALHVAARDPATFRAVAWHAGDCGFDLCYLEDLPKAIRGLAAAGGVQPFLDGFWARRRVDGDAFAALNILAMSCAYADRLDPLPDALPFDPTTGEVRFDVLQAWRRHDPIVRLDAEPAFRDALAGLDSFTLDVGDRDEYLLHLGARRFVAALRRHGVPHDYEEFAGGHRGTAWRYDLSLPRLASALHRA
jgi:S-formylglutathione hydrolase FrmB